MMDGGGAPKWKEMMRGNSRHVPVVYDKTGHFAFLCASCKNCYAGLCCSWRPDSCIAKLNKKNGGGSDSFFFPSPTLRVLAICQRDGSTARERRKNIWSMHTCQLIFPSPSLFVLFYRNILQGSSLSKMLKQNAPT